MHVDYIRVYQPKNAINIGCDPVGFPTSNYINNYIEAYTNPNLTVSRVALSRSGWLADLEIRAGYRTMAKRGPRTDWWTIAKCNAPTPPAAALLNSLLDPLIPHILYFMFVHANVFLGEDQVGLLHFFSTSLLV